VRFCKEVDFLLLLDVRLGGICLNGRDAVLINWQETCFAQLLSVRKESCCFPEGLSVKTLQDDQALVRMRYRIDFENVRKLRLAKFGLQKWDELVGLACIAIEQVLFEIVIV